MFRKLIKRNKYAFTIPMKRFNFNVIIENINIKKSKKNLPNKN